MGKLIWKPKNLSFNTKNTSIFTAKLLFNSQSLSCINFRGYWIFITKRQI